MKTVSQRDLNKLIKREGWELTPDSKKAIQEHNVASVLSKQVEAITNLAESVDGVSEAVRAENANTTCKISEALRSLAFLKETKGTPPAAAPEPDSKGWRFIVKRTPDGMISEVVAEKT